LNSSLCPVKITKDLGFPDFEIQEIEERLSTKFETRRNYWFFLAILKIYSFEGHCRKVN
jgi:hypothetical protein